MTNFLIDAVIFLGAAVLAVPLAKRLGLGSVLGYLIAGIAIGPVFGVVGDEAIDIQHFAEFGVVMMLFLVGLELEPHKLWSLRHKLLGLGGLQVGLTCAAIFGIAYSLGLSWKMSLAIGLVLALSSTAIVLQTLNEKGMMKTQGGQSSFSVLLFQDIAVIPMLALLPLLAVPELMGGDGIDAHHGEHLLEHFSGIVRALITFGVIAGIILAGHYLARPAFQYIAATRLREIFTAFGLLLVLGISVLMTSIGLSPALGAFLAGVVLAESEYRHELESTIEPFKGLLLGLFFMTVGAGVNFVLLNEQLGTILLLTFTVILVKFVILFLLAKIFRLETADQWLFAGSLAQAGEFGFVLLAFCVQNAVLPQEISDQLLLVIALSMLFTPLLFIALEKVILPRLSRGESIDADEIDAHSNIIIAGNGRFGQMINRLLTNCGYAPTVIDLDIDAIKGFSKFGIKSYFGDASRPELLESAGIANSELFVLAIDDKERAIQVAEYIHQNYPHVSIVARAFDRRHCYDLYRAGATEIVRETFDSSVRAGKYALRQLGFSDAKASEVSEMFYYRDRHSVQAGADAYDPNLPRFKNEKLITRIHSLNEETGRMIQELIKDGKQ